MRTGSYVQARFKGQQEHEFTWFALGSTLPLISMSAERAARQIVRATQRGAAECILSLPANIVGRLHGLCPGTTANLLGLVNHFLPEAEGTRSTSTSGMEVQQRLRSPLLRILTSLGRAAARRLHQHTPADAASVPSSSAPQHHP
jgi:hypothetical protein